METKRQKQVAEMVKRHFSIMLQQEGPLIYGSEVLVTVTKIVIAPDLKQAKVYLSVYNTLDKQTPILELRAHYNHLKQALYHRLRNQLRRMPDFDMYLDDTLDEMYRLNELFNKLDQDNQLGKHREEEE